MTGSRRRVALMITALSLERDAVVTRLTDCNEQNDERGVAYACGVAAGWDVVVVQTGTGNVSAAIATERAIERWNPGLALLVGIAGGVKDVKIGDVAVATKVYGYESGVDRESFGPRPMAWLPSYPLSTAAAAVAREAKWRAGITLHSDRATETPAVVFGAVAAGEKVVKAVDGHVADLISRFYSDSVAVEMEAAGFSHAAYAASVDALVVRGISDLLAGKEAADRDGSQRLAADHAAAFAFEVLDALSQRAPRDVAAAARTAGAFAGAEGPAESWIRLGELCARLYPRGPGERAIWQEAGGDLSRLDLSESGRVQWSRALRLLRQGGGGAITRSGLVSVMVVEFPNNYELQHLHGMLMDAPTAD